MFSLWCHQIASSSIEVWPLLPARACVCVCVVGEEIAIADPNLEALNTRAAEIWEQPVVSGIHPIAATRQNEGPHAYTREFMALEACLASECLLGCMNSMRE